MRAVIALHAGATKSSPIDAAVTISGDGAALCGCIRDYRPGASMASASILNPYTVCFLAAFVLVGAIVIGLL